MADWYYARDGQQYGPINSAQLKQLAQSGGLVPDDLVFREGSKDWVAASTVQGLFPAPAPAPARGSAPAARPPASQDPGSFSFEETAPPPAAGGHKRPAAVAAAPRPAADEDDAPAAAGGMGDLLMFRRMIAPWIIMVLFWLGILGVVLSGLGMLISGVFFLGHSAMMGLGMMLGGLLFIPIGFLYVRLLSEISIVLFRIHETLADLREILQRQQPR